MSEKQITVQSHSEKGNYGGYPSSNMLQYGTCSYYCSPQSVITNDWMIFKISNNEIIFPTKIQTKGHSSYPSNQMKQFNFSIGSPSNNEWVKCNNNTLVTKYNTSMQEFQLNLNENQIKNKQYKHFKLEILNCHGALNYICMEELKIFGTQITPPKTGKHIHLTVHSHKKSQSGYPPLNLLKSDSTYYCNTYESNADKNDWIIFDISDQNIKPTKICIKAMSSMNYSPKQLNIYIGSQSTNTWIQCNNNTITTIKNTEMQEFVLNVNENQVKNQKYKQLKLEILNNHGGQNQMAFAEFKLFGIDMTIDDLQIEEEKQSYYSNSEQWTHLGNRATFNESVVNFKSSGSSYGTKLISSGKYEWKIQSTFSLRWCIWIGISTDFAVFKSTFTAEPYAILWCNNCRKIQGNIGSGHTNLVSVNKYWNSGDRITVKLDLDSNTIEWHLNENETPIATYSNVPSGSYKIAVWGHAKCGFEIMHSINVKPAKIKNKKIRFSSNEKQIELTIHSHKGSASSYPPENLLQTGDSKYYCNISGKDANKNDWIIFNGKNQELMCPTKIQIKAMQSPEYSPQQFNVFMGCASNNEWIKCNKNVLTTEQSTSMQELKLNVNESRISHNVTNQFKLEILNNHGGQNNIAFAEFKIFGVSVAYVDHVPKRRIFSIFNSKKTNSKKDDMSVEKQISLQLHLDEQKYNDEMGDDKVNVKRKSWVKRNASYMAASLSSTTNAGKDEYLPINLGSIVVLIAGTADLITDLLYAYTADFVHTSLLIACWLFISFQIIPQVIIGIYAIYFMLTDDNKLIPWIITKIIWNDVLVKYLYIFCEYSSNVIELVHEWTEEFWDKIVENEKIFRDKLFSLLDFKKKDLFKLLIWIIILILNIAMYLICAVFILLSVITVLIILMTVFIIGCIIYLIGLSVLLTLFLFYVLIIAPLWIFSVLALYIIAAITKLLAIENSQHWISKLLVQPNDNKNKNKNNSSAASQNSNNKSNNWRIILTNKIKIKKNVFNGLVLIETISESLPQIIVSIINTTLSDQGFNNITIATLSVSGFVILNVFYKIGYNVLIDKRKDITDWKI